MAPIGNSPPPELPGAAVSVEDAAADVDADADADADADVVELASR